MADRLLEILCEFERRHVGLFPDKQCKVFPSGEPSHFPWCGIEIAKHDPDPTGEPGQTTYALTVTVEIYVQADDSGAGSSLVELLGLRRQSLNAMLADDAGNPLSGLVDMIDEGPMPIARARLASKETMGLVLAYDIQYRDQRVSG